MESRKRCQIEKTYLHVIQPVLTLCPFEGIEMRCSVPTTTDDEQKKSQQKKSLSFAVVVLRDEAEEEEPRMTKTDKERKGGEW